MLFLGTLFAIMVAYLPGVVSSTIAGRWAALSIGVALMLLFTNNRPLLGKGHLWAGLLFGWAALTVCWSASPYDSFGELSHWLLLGLLFLAASQYKGDPELTLALLVTGLLLSLPFAFLQVQGQTPVVATDAPAGLFLSRNALGEVAAVLLVWAIARRSWALIPGPAFLVALSGSRGAFLAVAVGLAFDKKLWPLAATIACAVAFFVHGHTTSAIIRLEILQVTLFNLTVLGHGLETFGTIAPVEFAHNDPLQLIFELGIGALFAGALFVRSASSPAYPETRALLALAGASLVSFPLHHPVGAALMAVLSGYCCGVRDRDERAKSILRASYSLSAERRFEPLSTGNLRQAGGRG